MIYGILFDWLVDRINLSLRPPDAPPHPATLPASHTPPHPASAASCAGTGSCCASFPSASRVVGLLDVFGFEHVRRNSLEQLLINFTNEKLLHLCLHDSFTKQLALYTDEGILDNATSRVAGTPAAMARNIACIELLGTRLLPLLNSISMVELNALAQAADGSQAELAA